MAGVRHHGPYFAGSKPRVLAHRGFGPPENTLPAFRAALEAGAQLIESDVHLTADGVVVLAHDTDLSRLTGVPTVIAETEWARLCTIDVGGAALPSLEEALTALPDAKWNLDLKVDAVAVPAAEIIRRLAAEDRVLIAAFSSRRRRRAQRLLPRTAASAGPGELLAAYAAGLLGLHALARHALRHVDAVQIPRSVGPLRLDSRRAIAAFHRAGVEVHFWTIDDAGVMRLLLERGADGIVTDRTDVAVDVVAAM